MAVAWMLARAGIRHRPRGWVGFVVVVALGIGVSLASFEMARRTEAAFPAYLERANVGELLVNPNLSDARAEELIATTPGVTSYSTDDLLTAGIDRGRPITQAEVDGIALVVRMSSDDRYIEQDRPVVERGRMLEAGAEVFLNRAAAEQLGLDVGSEVALAFYRPSFTVGFSAPDVDPAQDDIVKPIGRASARVVGIGTLATDVLPDDLYPQSVMLISPEVGEQFSCTFNPIVADEDLTLEEHLLTIFPSDCALAYRYFSLQIAGGDDAVAAVTDELLARFEAANQLLPAVVRENDIRYYLTPISTSEERARVTDSVRPPAAALRLFALIAGLATVVLALLSALRIARRERANLEIFRQLGVTDRERVVALVTPLAAGVVLGLVGAVAVGFVGSGVGAVASVRVLEPGARFGLAWSVFALAAAVGAALFVGMIAIAGLGVWSPAAPPVERPSTLQRLTGVLHPARRLGVHAATRGLGAATVGIGAITAVLAVVASLGFATSVNDLVGTPSRYGWPYDVGVIIGYGYGGSDVDAISDSLERPEVERWGLAALGTAAIGGETLPAVAERERFARVSMPVIDGRRPDGPGEIALGAASAKNLDADVGDTVSVVTDYGAATATVTGLVVLPPVGSYQSSRASPGTGVLLSEPLFEEILTTSEEAQGLPPGSLTDVDLGSFLAIELADGVNADQFLASIDTDERRSWNRNGFEPFVYPRPVRPSAIADVASMRRLPIALGGVFALAMTVGLTTGIAGATRARRRELAILGALGCTPRQLVTSVRWHALTVVSIALLVGVPLGMVVGRMLYRDFAVDLGVVPTVTSSVPAMAGVAVGTIVVGLLASALPAHPISRARRALSLREE